MKKRGQTTASRIIIYMLIAIVAILIFYFGYRAVFGVTEAEETAMLETLKLQQKADVSRISTEEDVTRSYAYQLPRDYNEFCFVDLTRKNKIDMDYLKSAYPIIYNSLQSNANDNAFLFGKDVQAYNVGDIRVDCEPYFACFEKTGTRLLYRLKGMGTYAMPDVCEEITARPPYFESTDTDPVNLNVAPGTEIKFEAVPVDPEGSDLEVKWFVGSEEITEERETKSSGELTDFTRTFGELGYYYVKVQATDEQGLSASHLFRVRATLTPGNNPPEFVLVDGILVDYAPLPEIDVSLGERPVPVVLEVTQGKQIQFTLNAQDPDADFLTYSAQDLPSGAGFYVSTKQFLWTPMPTGEYKMLFNVSDARGGNDELDVKIMVTPPPYLACGACEGTQPPVITLSSLTNAHASTQDIYSQRICCKIVGADDSVVNSQTTACDSGIFVRLSGVTNAHAEKPGLSTAGYQDVCLKSTEGQITCEAKEACEEGEACVVKLSADMNAHLETCGQDNYGTSICCKLA